MSTALPVDVLAVAAAKAVDQPVPETHGALRLRLLLGRRLHGHDAQRVVQLELAVEHDLHVVGAGLAELQAAENVDVGAVAFLAFEGEIDLGRSQQRLLVGGDDARDLLELADAGGPAGPDAELEDLDGKLGAPMKSTMPTMVCAPEASTRTSSQTNEAWRSGIMRSSCIGREASTFSRADQVHRAGRLREN
ncbi:MAG: hypothetical protein WDO13_09145 [Verrucomicrobiota bacterium]